MARTGLRQRGLIGICGLAMSSAVVAAPGADAAVERTTAKGTEPFAQCFAASQDRASQAWWFVPKGNGGTFSHLGATGVSQPYFVDIADKGGAREVRVTLASGAAERSVVRAVESCI